jgi:hypothetical protein
MFLDLLLFKKQLAYYQEICHLNISYVNFASNHT